MSVGVSLVWIVAVACLIAAAILAVVGSWLRHGGRAATRAGAVMCAQVQPGCGPLHLSGASAGARGG